MKTFCLFLLLFQMQVFAADATDNASSRTPDPVVLGRTYGDRPGEFRWTPGLFDAVYAVYDLFRRVIGKEEPVKKKKKPIDLSTGLNKKCLSKK